MKKRESKNKLECRLTQQIRQSNQFYIKKRADKAGVTEDVFRSYYTTKSALSDLKKRLKADPWDEVRLSYGLSTQELVLVLQVNGRGAQLDQFRNSQPQPAETVETVETDQPAETEFVPTELSELATA